jgi:sugar-specific transcriptional regulator TrmB
MHLERFGFTPTESRVYAALLQLSRATGYAVAQRAGFARANAYDALESLAARGAVSRLPGRPAHYVAVEPDVLIGRLRHETARDLEALTAELGSLQRQRRSPAAAGLETVDDGKTFLDRVAMCARSAREELLAVVGPWASEVYKELEAAARRGVTLRLLCLGTPAPRAAAVRSVPVGEIEAYWGGLPVALVADRHRAVCGVMHRDGTAAGVVTEHPGVLPFVRHLLRRELASTTAPRVS